MQAHFPGFFLLSVQALGQVGRVIKVRPNSDVRISVNGQRWVVNPRCLTPAPEEVPPEEKIGKLIEC